MDAATMQEIAEVNTEKEEGMEQVRKMCYRRQCLLPSLIIFCTAIYEIAEALLKTSTRLHILRLSCLYVTQDSKLCSHEPNKTMDVEVDGRIQSVAAPYIISYTVLLNGPATISCLFLGSWSDHHGRKKVLMLSLVGQILACVSCSVSYLPGVGHIPGGTLCLLIGVLIYGACGKSTVFLIGASSYVTDCSTKERRTRLLSRLIGVGFFGNCIGYAFVSIFITFQWILMAVSITAVVLFVAILLFVKETVIYDPHKIMNEQVIKAHVPAKDVEVMEEEEEEERKNRVEKNESYPRTDDCENAMLVPMERREPTGLCFTVAHIAYFLLRKRDRCDRVHIITLLLCCFISHMVKVGENDAMLLYVTREGVGWNDKIYGAYLSANYVAMSLQLLVVYPLLERLFNPSDETCIIFGASVRILTFAATGLTNKTSLLFAYGLLGSFGAFVTCAGRSSLTKLTSEEEVGTMLALTSFLEVLSATIGSSLFTEVFVVTREYFTGTVFFILAALQGGILMSLLRRALGATIQNIRLSNIEFPFTPLLIRILIILLELLHHRMNRDDRLLTGLAKKALANEHNWKPKMFQKILPNLVIFIFSIYKITETLLQTSTRLQVYHLVCAYVTQTDTWDLKSVCYSFVESDTTPERLDQPIQRQAAPFIIGYRILLNLPAMFVCLVLGSWSDQNGRKGPMILPIIGACLACCVFGISLIPGYSSIPFQMAWLLAGALLYGLCGKSNALGMGAHSYITDCSTEGERTTRISRLLGTNFVGLCIGSLLVTVFYYFSSYGWVLLFATALNLSILSLLVLLVKDSVVNNSSESPSDNYGSLCMLEYRKQKQQIRYEEELNEGNVLKSEGEKEKKYCCCQTVRTSLKESWDYIIKVRPNGRHVYIRILLGAVLFNQVTKAGEQDSLLLFVVRQGVGWSDGIYGAYLATYYASMALNLILIFPIVEHLFRPSDISLILFGLAMKTVRLLGTALTTNTVLIFVLAVLGSPAGYIISALRSLITKLVDSGEVGTSFAIMSVFETLANLFGSIVFTSVYAATVTVFPGTVFVIDACLHVGMFALMIWLGWRLRTISTSE
ncbi:unnamed protein product [Hydatigera taeniaeformis]|uniref:Proton-coupled folate transporter n=1 Tax=Hydatigena taeniaeformis TaxID=6205 RepID=A0A0R3WHS7_HYDTA|nr:unnamed protein product [Hydatigera taeniaeformis]